MANGLFGGGDGTKGNPYLIEDAEDLNAIRNIEANHYFKQVSDIDLSSYNWVSLASNLSGAFFSSYDGGNFIIDNLSMKGAGHSSGGLFGYCVTQNETDPKHEIKNIYLKNVSIEIPTASRVGMLAVGLIRVKVFNCHVEGSVYGGNNVGGFTQEIEGSVIDRCSIKGTVKGSKVGGFTCYMSANTLVSNCYVSADIYGTDDSYSFLGSFGYQTYEGTVNNCYTLVNMKTDASLQRHMYLFSDIGDVIYNSCYTDITSGITDMEWLDNVAYYGVVMLRGTDNSLYENIQSQPALDYDYWEDAWGNTGPPAWWPGPMYRARPTSGADWQEYWEIITPSTREGARYTTQMKQQSNYIGWDFETIWGIDANINDGYPYLRNLKVNNINMFANVGNVWIKAEKVYAKKNGVWVESTKLYGKTDEWKETIN